jgi:hypothetical protein
MGTSGGASLWNQSGKHFRELGKVGDCLIIEEPQADFYAVCGHSILVNQRGTVGHLETVTTVHMEFICVPQVGIQIKSHKKLVAFISDQNPQ